MMQKHLLNDILDPNEKLLWEGKPVFVPFILSGVPFLLLGLLWGLMDVGIMRGAFDSSSQWEGRPDFFLIPFFALHMFPVWLSILNMARLFLVFNNTMYAFTNRRIIIRTGFWGIDYRSVDYDQVANVDVNVNPIDTMFGVGTIRIDSGNRTSKGGIAYDSISAVRNPYEVFKKLKTVSLDIKTDWNYPNDLRPEKNSGYKTEYK